MHICFLTHEYPEGNKSHGGIGTFISTIAPALMVAGHKVTVIGLSQNEIDKEEIDRNVQIKRLRRSKWKRFSFIDNSSRLNQAIKKVNSSDRIDVLEASELGFAFIRKTSNIKFIIRLHGGHHFFAEAEKRKINFWKAFQEKRSFRKADAFIGVSDYVVQNTRKYLSFQNRPIEIIYNPINSDKFYKSDQSKLIPKRILFVGTLCEKKGVRELVLGFKSVKSKTPEALLILTGRDWKYPDGISYSDKMKELVSVNKIEGIEFTGPVNYNDLPIEYEKAEICAFPSHMETQGMVALEAMSMAKPVIFSNVGPGKETIEDGVNGLLADPYSPEDIAEKINYLLENKEIAKQIGGQARVRILEKYNLNKIVEENINFYKSLLHFSLAENAYASKRLEDK